MSRLAMLHILLSSYSIDWSHFTFPNPPNEIQRIHGLAIPFSHPVIHMRLHVVVPLAESEAREFHEGILLAFALRPVQDILSRLVVLSGRPKLDELHPELIDKIGPALMMPALVRSGGSAEKLAQVDDVVVEELVSQVRLVDLVAEGLAETFFGISIGREAIEEGLVVALDEIDRGKVTKVSITVAKDWSTSRDGEKW
jgi:hypothetical protein